MARRAGADDIHAALDRAYEAAPVRPVGADERVVVFSDHHKGARDGADDFQRSERGYNAALTYYDRLGYHLVELGDVEELWENKFDEVAGSYEVTLRLAARFQAAGRYTRVWGNHDLAWNKPAFFQDRMKEFGYGDVTPVEAVRLAVDAGDGRTLELFLVHGHQGTADSDRNAWLSRLFVRFGWRALQRLLNRPWNTPSVDWSLRGEHAAHMSSWAAERKRVLIAGHTHAPVFFNSRKEAEAVAVAAAEAGDREDALRLARAAWATAEQERLRRNPPIELATPCYFNTGCCSFGDGDITGLEISDGAIKLIRWACDPKPNPEPPLASMALARVAELTT
jgi:hypothetical protein